MPMERSLAPPAEDLVITVGEAQHIAGTMLPIDGGYLLYSL